MTDQLFRTIPSAYGPEVYETLPHQKDSATSIAAAEKKGQSAHVDRARVMLAIFMAGEGGMTREELAIRLDMKIQSVCPRVHELVEDGWAKPGRFPDGSAMRRQTSTSSMAEVLVATAEGESWAIAHRRTIEADNG